MTRRYSKIFKKLRVRQVTFSILVFDSIFSGQGIYEWSYLQRDEQFLQGYERE